MRIRLEFEAVALAVPVIGIVRLNLWRSTFGMPTYGTSLTGIT
jgi:hypothetical protein